MGKELLELITQYDVSEIIMPTVSVYIKDEVYNQMIRLEEIINKTWRKQLEEALNDYLTRQKTLPG